MNHPDSQADDLQAVVDMLRANRPEATALELDAVKQRVRARMAPGRRARSANLMKSRLAILSMLVTGILASTTGVGLAIDGLSGSDASVAQYGPTPTPTTSTTPTPTPSTSETPTPTPTTPGGGNNQPPGGVLGEGEHHNPGGGNNENNGGGGPNGGGNNNNNPLQPSRQVETGAAGSGQLPFTGFLAIPVLIGGIVLLSTGLVLRRRAARDDQS
jgi:hypothetical protein